MGEAIESTKLTDFGEIPFEDGLEALLDSMNSQNNFHENTTGYLRAKIVQILANRLQINALIHSNPRILEEEIEKPIIIAGLPRSGTTILQTLIALDPNSRFVRNWESALNICPPPRLLHSDTDSRIQTFHQTIEMLLQMSPSLNAINGLNFIAGGTAECQNLMAHAFRSMEFCAGFGLRSYGEWLVSCDMKPGYACHKLLLKVLQYQWPNERWVLKAPMHLIAFDLLMDAYPDARLVFTHRDPLTSMLSAASLVYNWSKLAMPCPEKKQIGRWFSDIWEKAMQKALKAREKQKQKNIKDVYFGELNADPIETVKAIYAHFGLTVSCGHEKRMGVWLRDNPRSSFGKHSYVADDFGLSREAEEQRFAFYKTKFNV